MQSTTFSVFRVRRCMQGELSLMSYIITSLKYIFDAFSLLSLPYDMSAYLHPQKPPPTLGRGGPLNIPLMVPLTLRHIRGIN